MNTRADKTQENKSRSVTNEFRQKQRGGEPTFQFVDNRPETIAQRKLQEMANNCSRVKQLKAIQKMANNNPQTKKAAQLQAITDNYTAGQQKTIQKKEKKTGLPDNLKSGVENLSGYSMDDVKVHYNSEKPAQLNAHAYAQGTDIHVASGQEKHLPHEAWHVVQQKQGRVKPTIQMKGGESISDDAGLEREADNMGMQALEMTPHFTLQRKTIKLNPSSVIQKYSDEEMAEFHKKRQQEQTEELANIASMKKVSIFFGEPWTKKHWELKEIHVGVTFRTDSRGSAHTGHDMEAVKAMNDLGLPFTVVGVTLPRGAEGGLSPERIAKPDELDGIDLLYVPGGPTANDTQTGANPEDANFNRPMAPTPVDHPGEFELDKPVAPPAPEFDRNDIVGFKDRLSQYKASQQYRTYIELNEAYNAQRQVHEQRMSQYSQFIKEHEKFERINKEHTERASYELKLIEMAKTRGIPVMAVCAGSWRLLESYGGEVRTLPPQERAVHKATDTSQTWNIGHDITVESGTILSGMMGRSGISENVNTTHWAVASEDVSGRLKKSNSDQEPNDLLTVTARTTGGNTREILAPTDSTHSITVTNTDEHEKTVEGFESRYGAPNLGLQWHPEGYLPGMQGQDSGSAEIRSGSRNMFKAMAEAAAASKTRRSGIVPNLNKDGHLDY